jgi:hypothetical protein
MVRKISENEFGPRAVEIDQKEEFPWENKKILEAKNQRQSLRSKTGHGCYIY